jgi:hypothetical protein
MISSAYAFLQGHLQVQLTTEASDATVHCYRTHEKSLFFPQKAKHFVAHASRCCSRPLT